jgi:hypothetical protein
LNSSSTGNRAYRTRSTAAPTSTAKSRQLTAGQRRVVGHLCQDAGAATVVVGVAGPGKTTALDAASTALESAGYRVLGSSTSGQAARTLGREADLPSRTLASLLARLQHGTWVGMWARSLAGWLEGADRQVHPREAEIDVGIELGW